MKQQPVLESLNATHTPLLFVFSIFTHENIWFCAAHRLFSLYQQTFINLKKAKCKPERDTPREVKIIARKAAYNTMTELEMCFGPDVDLVRSAQLDGGLQKPPQDNPSKVFYSLFQIVRS